MSLIGFLFEFETSLYLPLIAYFLIVLGLLFFTFKFYLFGMAGKNTDLSPSINFKIKILLAIFAISFSSIFSGIYQTHYFSLIHSQSLFLFVVSWAIYSIIIYLIMFFLVKILKSIGVVRIYRYHVLIKSNYRYALFFIVLLLMSSLFIFQSLALVKDNEYTVASNVVPSSDFSKLYFIANNQYGKYLVIKNTQNNEFTKFSLLNCNSLTCSYPYNYLEISEKTNEAYIFLNDGHSGIIDVFNYKNKSLYESGIYGEAFVLNNRLYASTYSNKSIFLTPISSDLYNLTNFITLNLTSPINYYSISPDFTKLVTVNTKQLQNGSYEIINQYFTINIHLTTNLSMINNYTQILPLYPAFNSFFNKYLIINPDSQFIWDNTSSTVSYSFFQGTNTTIYSFNFTSLKTSKIGEIQSHVNIINVDLVHSLIILDPFKIYSFSNSNLVLKQQNDLSLINWDNSKNAGVAVTNKTDDVYLLSYNEVTNYITQKNLLFPSVFVDEKGILSDLFIYSEFVILVTLVITLFFLIKEIIGYRSYKKRHRNKHDDLYRMNLREEDKIQIKKL